jgi:hypothetical protein
MVLGFIRGGAVQLGAIPIAMAFSTVTLSER